MIKINIYLFIIMKQGKSIASININLKIKVRYSIEYKLWNDNMVMKTT